MKLASVAAALVLPSCRDVPSKDTPVSWLDVSKRQLAGKTGVVGIEAERAFTALSASDKDALKQRKVFFGHQSVGQNLVDGARMIGFPFARVTSGAELAATPWGEAKIDKNRAPLEKISSFHTFLTDKGMGAVDVAGFKFCWIDFNANSNVDDLLAKYDAEVKLAKEKFPALRILHITPPLTTNEPKLNAIRWQFGRALVARYKNDGLVLDLAEVVSTTADGGVCERGGSPRMCTAWALDRGHLNAVGSQRAARAFVIAVHRLLNEVGGTAPAAG
jgi:hypothetical protein